MDLVAFDLDNTLLSGDSDYLWGNYLCKVGAVDEKVYKLQNKKFYDDYCAGKLDIDEYLNFSLQAFAKNEISQLNEWREAFIREVIPPLISLPALNLVKQHLDKKNTVVVASSTNSFIVEPIANLFGIDQVIATDLEIMQQKFTGKVDGLPCYGENKLTKLKHWIDVNRIQYNASWFYSDSINDLPSLKWADYTIVVNGDDMLCKEARKYAWQSITIG